MTEQEKYQRAYQDTAYCMGTQRLADALQALTQFSPGTLLDVGAGRGEFVVAAVARGFTARGTELVPELCDDISVHHAEITALPFDDAAFDVVTCLDVLEHIPPDDTDRAIDELFRVGKSLIVSVANFSDVWHGIEMHINRREYDEWDALFKRRNAHARRLTTHTPMWIVKNDRRRRR